MECRRQIPVYGRRWVAKGRLWMFKSIRWSTGTTASTYLAGYLRQLTNAHCGRTPFRYSSVLWFQYSIGTLYKTLIILPFRIILGANGNLKRIVLRFQGKVTRRLSTRIACTFMEDIKTWEDRSENYGNSLLVRNTFLVQPFFPLSISTLFPTICIIESHSWKMIHGGKAKKSSDVVPPPRHSHAAVVFDQEMWVYGGMTDLAERSDFWRLDLGIAHYYSYFCSSFSHQTLYNSHYAMDVCQM